MAGLQSDGQNCPLRICVEGSDRNRAKAASDLAQAGQQSQTARWGTLFMITLPVRSLGDRAQGRFSFQLLRKTANV